MGRIALELVGLGALGYSFDPLTENRPNKLGDAIKATMYALLSPLYISIIPRVLWHSRAHHVIGPPSPPWVHCASSPLSRTSTFPFLGDGPWPIWTTVCTVRCALVTPWTRLFEKSILSRRRRSRKATIRMKSKLDRARILWDSSVSNCNMTRRSLC